MLLVKTELHPYGDSSSKSTLCTVAIANIGRSVNGYYDYLVVAKEKEMFGGILYAVKVVEHDRNLPLFNMLSVVFSGIKDFYKVRDCDTSGLTDNQLMVFNILKSRIELEV